MFRFLLLCVLRDGRELFGVKLGQLPGPDGYQHRVLDAGPAAASVPRRVVLQADSWGQAFPLLRLPLAFLGAVLLLAGSRALSWPPQQTPAASYCCRGPWAEKEQALVSGLT